MLFCAQTNTSMEPVLFLGKKNPSSSRAEGIIPGRDGEKKKVPSAIPRALYRLYRRPPGSRTERAGACSSPSCHCPPPTRPPAGGSGTPPSNARMQHSPEVNHRPPKNNQRNSCEIIGNWILLSCSSRNQNVAKPAQMLQICNVEVPQDVQHGCSSSEVIFSAAQQADCHQPSHLHTCTPSHLHAPAPSHLHNSTPSHPHTLTTQH